MCYLPKCVVDSSIERTSLSLSDCLRNWMVCLYRVLNASLLIFEASFSSFGHLVFVFELYIYISKLHILDLLSSIGTIGK